VIIIINAMARLDGVNNRSPGDVVGWKVSNCTLLLFARQVVDWNGATRFGH
jgi:hypothetical protein